MSAPIKFDVIINDSQFNDKIKNWIRGIDQVENKANSLDKTLQRVSGAIGAYFTVTFAKDLIQQIVKVRGEFQQLDIAFTTMLKSKQRSDQLMQNLVSFAAETPFGLKDAAQAAKQLLAYGSSAESVTDELRMLGDVASGVSAPIGDIVYLYGTLRTQGRAYAVDIRQFAGRGIPIYEELAKVLRINTNEVQSFVEAGKVGFKEVEQAFKNMTAQGGLFGGLMEKQSKSVVGQLERLKDAIDVMFNQLGQNNQGAISGTIAAAAKLVENYETVLNTIKTLIITYGAYRAAIMLLSASQALEQQTALAVTAGVTRKSSALEREVALKVRSAQASAQRAVFLSRELKTEAEMAMVKVQSLRTETAALFAKRAAAKAELIDAQRSVAARRAEVAAINQSGRAKQIEAANTRLNNAVKKEETARIAHNAAIREAATKKIQLESAARAANTLTTRADSASKAANTAVANANTVANTKLTAAKSLQLMVTKQLAAAQAYLNSTMLANPIVAATVALAAIAAAMYFFADRTTYAEKALKRFNDFIDENEKRTESLKNKSQELISVIESETATQFGKVKAFKELQKVFPQYLNNLTLQQFQAIRAKDAQERLNKSLEAFSANNIQAEYEKVQMQIIKMQNKIKDLQKASANAGTNNVIAKLLGDIKVLEKQADKLQQQLQDIRETEFEAKSPEFKLNTYNKELEKLKQIRAELENQIKKTQQLDNGFYSFQNTINNINLDAINQQIDNILKKIKDIIEGTKETPLTKLYWEKQKKDAEEALAGFTELEAGTAKWNEQLKKLRLAEAKLKIWDFSQKKSDDTGPFGSIKYWDSVAKKAQEALEKSTNPEEMVRLQNTIATAQEQAEDLRKKYAIRSFEEEIEFKKEQYAMYWEFVELLGEEAANKQFQGLRAQGDTFRRFLENQIKELKAVENRTPKQNERLNFLNNELKKDTNQKSALELFKEEAESQKATAKDLYEYLQWLHMQLEEAKTDISQKGQDKRDEIMERMRTTQIEITNKEKTDYQKYVDEFGSYEQKKLKIQQDYQKKRDAVIKEGNFSLLAGIDAAMDKELKELDESFFKMSKAYIKLNERMLVTTRAALKKRVDELKGLAVWAAVTFGPTSEVYKTLKRAQVETSLELDAFDTQRIQQWGQLLSNASEVLENMGDNMKGLGSFIAGVVSQTNNLTVALSKSADKGEKTIAAINAGLSIVNMIASSAQQRRKAEEEYYQSVIGQQREYNILLNEQIRLNAELGENVFLKDYEGRIIGGIKALQDANSKYLEALNNLSKAQVSLGKTKAIDWGAVGTGASAGAAIGFAAGTIVPVIGNAVGAWVGALVGAIGGAVAGLFGGKKKKDIWGSLLETFPTLITTGANGVKQLDKELLKSIQSQNILNEESKELVQHVLTWAEKVEEAKEQIKGVISELAGSLGNDIRTALVEAFQTGEDAAAAFGKSVEKVMEDVLSQMIFNSVFNDAFDQLQKNLTASYDFGGDGSWLDDFGKFFQDAGSLWETFYKGLEEAQNSANQFGLNLWKEKASDIKGMSGAVKGVTEQTAGVIEGQMNAIRINQIDSISVMRQQLFNLAEIASNTRFLNSMNTYLQSIDKKTTMQYDSLKAKGFI